MFGFYSKFETDFILENYLNCTIFKYRAVLTRTITPKLPYPPSTGFVTTATKSVKSKKIESEEHEL